MSRFRSESGATLVELAIVIPVLALLLTGITDVGRMLWIQGALEEAAQEGATFAVLNPAGDIEGRIRTSSSSPVDLSDPTEASVAITCVSDTVTVSVSHNVELITPFMGAFFGTSSRPVTATVVGDLVGNNSC